MPSEAARQRVERAKRRLRRSFPISYPARVVWVTPERLFREEGKSCWGHHWYDGTRGEVWLSHACGQHQAVETLVEEWSHLLRYQVPGLVDGFPHDEVYGAIFNLISRWWHGEVVKQ